MSLVKVTNVEQVLPNDEELGRRNCRWRELIKKYEERSAEEGEHAMDIDVAMKLLDEDMSTESSVSDVEEGSSKDESEEENPEEIKRQLRKALPKRKRAWEENGLKEILDDQEFRMLSHEKVENWLRNHMHSITGHFNVHYEAQQVTTVTETHMDADADSLYSVDTAQYIRSNKQISNKVKVTTMIKQYAVTSSLLHHERLNSLGPMHDGQSNGGMQRLSLPPLGRLQCKSDSSADAQRQRQLKRHTICTDLQQQNHQRSGTTQHTKLAQTGDPVRRTRKKVFKKTLPRKRPAASEPIHAGLQVLSPEQRYNQGEMYDKALEQCARMKQAKARRTICRRSATKNANRSYFSTSSSEDDSDTHRYDVFRADPTTRVPHKSLFVDTSDTLSPANGSQRNASQLRKTPPPEKMSPTERDIVEPLQSITLNTSSRQDIPQHSAGPGSATNRNVVQSRKPIGIQSDGSYHDTGVVVYRPKAIQPQLASSERIWLRMEDLRLDGVTKERHLAKFRNFCFRVHPNSTVCFYPSDSDSDEDELVSQRNRPSTATGTTETNEMDSSFDEEDPIDTFQPRKTSRLNVVEVPYRRSVTRKESH